MRRLPLWGATALIALSQPVLADKASNSINAAFNQEAASLDSYHESGRVGLIIGRLLYDGLLSKDHKTGEFVPELAQSYDIVSDTEISFKIRPGVKFHNGQTMTAEDVAYTLNKVSDPAYGARYSLAVGWIKDAKVTGEDTVLLTMKQPFPLALEMLAGNLPIYPKAYYEEAGPAGMGVKPVGTGPYRLVDMTQGVHFVLERFEDYYEGGQKSGATIDKLDLRVLPELNTQYAELMNGNLDWLWRVPTDDIERLARIPDVKVDSAGIMRIEYVGFNPNALDGKSPVADVRVRQAINHAINRDRMRKALAGDAALLMNSACNPVQFGCTQDVTRYDHDLDKAKALMAEAGYADGFEIELVHAAVPAIDAEVIAAELSKIGIKATLNAQQYASAIDMWRSGKAPFFLTNWGSYGVGDVGLSTGNFFGGSADDVIKDPVLVPIVAEANESMDRARREELYAQALRHVADQAYWVPLWTYSVNSPMANDLELKTDPDEFVPFYKARWN